MIRYETSTKGVDWPALVEDLISDRFHNGRTWEQLRDSFQNSQGVCFAWYEMRVVGKARVLSDGVGNAYLLDVWTKSGYRRQGIARTMIERLLEHLPGQHVYLQCDEEEIGFYVRLGFRPQPTGLSTIVGGYLSPTKSP